MAGNLKINLHSPLTDISGIGPKIAARLSKLNLHTVLDLLRHYPRKFLDYTSPHKIANLLEGKTVFLIISVSNVKSFRTRGGKSITTAHATDSSGTLMLTWFNNYFIAKTLKPDTTYYLTGRTSKFAGKLTIISPTIDLPDPNSLHTGRLVPVYRLTADIKSKFLRKVIHQVLDQIQIEDSLNLQPNLQQAFQQIHFPKDLTAHQLADKRLALNHHFRISYQNFLYQSSLPPAYSLSPNRQLDLALRQQLPFQLTDSQSQAIEEAYQDITKNQYTHRLIQGETGSGKTMVMLFLALQSLCQKTSFALLCPTKILASQHFATFSKFLSNYPIQLILANQKEISLDQPSVYIGTQSLINLLPNNIPHPLSILCVDEQHRFGVADREMLPKRNPVPHLFNFSATPIPRTLALGFFGDVSISTIKHKPRNNLVKTVITQPTTFIKNLTWLNKKLKSGSKIFVVTPSIHQNQSDQSAALTQYQFYRDQFPDQAIYLIHGEMNPKDIATNLQRFKQQDGGILVSTSIIEVGIDIPEAEIIIIHSAERFGLASLHQLRGRVGRGSLAGHCILIQGNEDPDTQARLKLLTRFKSGLVLAKHDWQLRGSGDIAGFIQHGHLPVNLTHFWDKDTYQQAKDLVSVLAKNSPRELTKIAASLSAW